MSRRKKIIHDDEMREYLGLSNDRLLAMVATKIDRVEDDISDLKEYNEKNSEKLWTHDMTLEAHKSDIRSILGQIDDIKSNVGVLSSIKNTNNKQTGFIRKNKDKIIITIITGSFGLLIYLITDNPDFFTWIIP